MNRPLVERGIREREKRSDSSPGREKKHGTTKGLFTWRWGTPDR